MPQGDKQTLMGLMNKQDYARWHSYQFHCSVGNADDTIRPAGALDVSSNPVLSLKRPLWHLTHTSHSLLYCALAGQPSHSAPRCRQWGSMPTILQAVKFQAATLPLLHSYDKNQT